MARYTDIEQFDVQFWIGANASPNIISIAADYAYTYINSRLASTYTVPFSTSATPSTIRMISDALTGSAAKALLKGEVLNRGNVENKSRTAGDVSGRNLVGWNPFTWLKEIVDGDASIDGETRIDGAETIIFKATPED